MKVANAGRSGVLLLFAAACLIVFAAPDIYGEAERIIDFAQFAKMTKEQSDDALSPIVEKRELIAKSLIQALKDPSLAKSSTVAAVYLSGLYRVEEVAPDLASLVTLRDDRRDNTMGRLPSWGRYPAAEALARIGMPAVPYLIRNLEESDEKEMRDVSASTLDGILGKNLARGALENVLRDPSLDHKEEARLRNALDLLVSTSGQAVNPASGLGLK